MTSTVAERYGITVTDHGSAAGLSLDAMVRLALRRNPLRAQLLVSTVLGKHIPVDPRVVAGMGRLLGALVAKDLDDDEAPLPDTWSKGAAAAVTGENPDPLLTLLCQASVAPRADVLTLGFAETATALGHLVADQLGSGYVHSTRLRSGNVPVAAEFSEPHSHATGHLLRPASPDVLWSAETVVLVDDELSTGRTALNVIEVLQAVRSRPRYVLAGLVDVRSQDADRQRSAAAERLGCQIDVVSMVSGSVRVPADAAARIATDLGAVEAARPEAVNPAIATSIVSVSWPAEVPLGGTHGFAPAHRPSFTAAVKDVVRQLDAQVGSARRVLVVGTEEFMYLPLRVALALSEDPGRAVAFQSTTRSPVHAMDIAGYPIRRRIDFRSTVDRGPHADRRFVYNADWPRAAAAEPDLVLIIDDGSAIDGPAGVAGAVAIATGAPVVLVAVGSASAR